MNDFIIQSTPLMLCLDVNGYAVRRTETVQLDSCQEPYDERGRISDQYLQFTVTYVQIGISARDAVIGLGDSATLTCTLYDAPKAPDYVIWKNRDVTVEEFKSVSGYSISTGIYRNNSLSSILTINGPINKPDVWTCLFIVDNKEFSASADIDIPNVTCKAGKVENDVNNNIKCMYQGKYAPSKVTWQLVGKTVKETERIYNIQTDAFKLGQLKTTIFLPRTVVKLTFKVSFVTPFKTVDATVSTGINFIFRTTSPPWMSKGATSYPVYVIENDTEMNGTTSAIGQEGTNKAAPLYLSYSILLALGAYHIAACIT